MTLSGLCLWVGWVLAAPAKIATVEPANLTSAVLEPGDSVAFYGSQGDINARETHSIAAGKCFEVHGVSTEGKVSVSLTSAEMLQLGASPTIRIGTCRPDGTREMSLPSWMPPDEMKDRVKHDDSVNVLTSLPPAAEVAETVTILRKVKVVGRKSWRGLILSAKQAEMYAHALDVGTLVTLSLLHHEEPPATSTRLSSLVPSGSGLTFVPVTTNSLAPFLDTISRMDMFVSVGDKTVAPVQSMTSLWSNSSGGSAPASLALLCNEKQAEILSHASQFLTPVYALRRLEDAAMIDDLASADTPIQLAAGSRPVERIPTGGRGLALVHEGPAPAVGTSVALKGAGCESGAVLVAGVSVTGTDVVVLAVMSPSQVLKATAAPAMCTTTAITPNP